MASTEHREAGTVRRPSLGGEDVAALSRQAGEGPALFARRRAAADRYLAAADPDRVTHLWRFTDPANLLPESVAISAAAVPHAAPHAEGAAARVLMLAGLRPLIATGLKVLAAGLVVKPLVEAEEELRALAARERTPDADPEEGLFQALNGAAWNTGLYVGVPPGAILTDPVHVVIDAIGPAVLPRLVVDLGEGAQAVVVEEHTGGDAGSRVVASSELHAADGARLRHVLVQTWREGVCGHLTARTRADRNADALTVFASFGGERSKVELATDLAGEGARSEMIGVVMGAGRQRFDHHTRHRHLAGRTWSNIDFKAVADASSRSSYTGLIRIEQDARGSEAYQENRNLLLTGGSRADSIPELEILNQDVSCSHGATVAPVDPEQVFYLQSRGLDPDEALRLVVRGFLEKTFSSLPADLRERLEALVGARLAALQGRAS
ncbi:MAG: Fe-S cluster assembly protein SufD [Candidatus Latescibacteria bacterium]|nr:Fe-S cluster assembly protein SufD [Candidatus Latescibacterota bacterium]